VSEVLVPEKKHLKTLERRIAHLEGRGLQVKSAGG